jgi:hypothetical protein
MHNKRPDPIPFDPIPFYTRPNVGSILYAHLIGFSLKSEVDINKALTLLLTQPLADFITENFQVINQEITSGDGFSAVVWQGKAGTDYMEKA